MLASADGTNCQPSLFCLRQLPRISFPRFTAGRELYSGGHGLRSSWPRGQIRRFLIVVDAGNVVLMNIFQSADGYEARVWR